MREAFTKQRFNSSTRPLIDKANTIIAEYDAQGFSLTLRQLYYQFVARGLIENTLRSYKRLGSVINNARLAGLIDWNAIEDRTRNLRCLPTWADPGDIVDSVANQYREDLWGRQPARPEVWIEKEALAGVAERACRAWRVPFFSCRGYTSQSEQYRAGKRFAEARRLRKRPVVLHLGDHDPSGLDMTRDNSDRLAMFARHDVEVIRLALNYDQVEQYSPPPNPAKETDSRSAGYIERYGESSWELDALDPTVIAALINDAVAGLVDHEKWKEDQAGEEERRRILEMTAVNWVDVADYVAASFGEE